MGTISGASLAKLPIRIAPPQEVLKQWKQALDEKFNDENLSLECSQPITIPRPRASTTTSDFHTSNSLLKSRASTLSARSQDVELAVSWPTRNHVEAKLEKTYKDRSEFTKPISPPTYTKGVKRVTVDPQKSSSVISETNFQTNINRIIETPSILVGSGRSPYIPDCSSSPIMPASFTNPIITVFPSSPDSVIYSHVTPGHLEYLRHWDSQNWIYPSATAISNAAQHSRNATSYYDARYTWSGMLPHSVNKRGEFSRKIFLGGVPWDINEQNLQQEFINYGRITVQWPGKDVRCTNTGASHKAGYLYVVFENESRVRALINSCTFDYNHGKYLYHLPSKRHKSKKEVEIIPWRLEDSHYTSDPQPRVDHIKTVFVGALHGVINAEALYKIIDDLFGNVVYVGIDTDKYKYPIGSGRVTFNNQKSFSKAVEAGFVDVKSSRLQKKIQIDPYLEDSVCTGCQVLPGPVFCRDMSCLRYYCSSCWHMVHSLEHMRQHRLIMRKARDRKQF